MYGKSVSYFMIIFALSFSANGKELLSHNFVAELLPEQNTIKVIDTITIPEVSTANSNNQIQKEFLLHTGNNIQISPSSIQWEKLYSANDPNPNYQAKQDQSQHIVPVDRYRITLPKNQKQITLQYERKIAHRENEVLQGLFSCEGTCENAWFNCRTRCFFSK